MKTTAHIDTTEHAHSRLAACISAETPCGALVDDVLQQARELIEATFDYTFDRLPYHVVTCTSSLLDAFNVYSEKFTFAVGIDAAAVYPVPDRQDWVAVANIVANAIGCAARNLGPSTTAAVFGNDAETVELFNRFDACLDLGAGNRRNAAVGGGWDGVDASVAVQEIRDELFAAGINLPVICSGV